jgi:hypothetical protein
MWRDDGPGNRAHNDGRTVLADPDGRRIVGGMAPVEPYNTFGCVCGQAHEDAHFE